MRRALLLAALGAALTAGCGAEDPRPAAAPGTPENPLQATNPEASGGGGGVHRNNEAATAPDGAPDYAKLVAGQSEDPERTGSPCDLVTKREAADILGRAVEQPVEAPQGPTCIFRAKGGGGFAGVAMAPGDMTALRRAAAHPRRLTVAGHRAICARGGGEMLHVEVGDGRVLSITAACDTARGFAERALVRVAR